MRRRRPAGVEPLQSMPADFRRALVVVAHPDDIEYGTAAAVAAWTAGGRDVSYLLLTRGEAGIDTLSPREAGAVREREQRASAAVVGVEDVQFLEHRDGTLQATLELRRDIARVMRGHRPDLVVTLNHHDTWGPGSWNTPDHRAAGRSVLDAVADAGNRWIFPELADEGLPPWAGVRWVAVGGSPYSTHAVDVTATLERGIASLTEHRTYLGALDPRPAEVQARAFYQSVTATTAAKFGGRRAIAFELALGGSS